MSYANQDNFNSLNDNSNHIYATNYSSRNVIGISTNCEDSTFEQILLLRLKLEQLRESKKNLENDNESLNCKINDLRLIIDRISKEDA